jgi:aminomethyltransferase
VVGDIAGLQESEGLLSLVTNENGGIIDDTVITNAGSYIYMVVNGATKFGDMEHFKEQLSLSKWNNSDITMEYLEDDYQLFALQGPGAADVVKHIVPSSLDITKMPFMTGCDIQLDGIDNCRITRYVYFRRC